MGGKCLGGGELGGAGKEKSRVYWGGFAFFWGGWEVEGGGERGLGGGREIREESR